MIRLREVRLAKELTLEQLSMRSGVSKAQISRIELGESDPTLSTMCKLAGALRVNPWEIFLCKRKR